MRITKFALALLLLSNACLSSPIINIAEAARTEKSIEAPPDEDDVGFISVRESIPKDKLPPEEQKEEVNPNALGLINVPGDVITPKNIPAADTEEGAEIASGLSKANTPHKKHQFRDALEAVEKVRKKHPEIPMLWEWRAIYLDLAGDYEESVEAWEEREKMFPFEKVGLERNYYKAESLYRIGEKAEADALVAEAYKEIEEGKGNIFGQTNKNTMLSVFNFLLLKNNRRTPQAIEALWLSIPTSERGSLGNFHGFNLSELWYWYGDAFGREDITKKFIDTERMNDNEDVIKVLKEALYTQKF